MSEPFEVAVDAGIEVEKMRLLIVDDDPVAAGMLGLMLTRHGYAVREVASGEDCLAVIDEFVPEIVLLDIEMPGGIDGYETCERVRNRFDRNSLSVIFLSSHDSLEERLRAYDVGGDDFVAKPFEAEEIRRKIALALSVGSSRRQLVAEKISLEETIDVAMQGYDEMGAVLKFTRSALAARTLSALAELMIASMRSTQVHCHVQLRGSAAAGTLTLTPAGLASPLEESVIELMSSHDRIFHFRSRMIINYERVSMLVVNMPSDDEIIAGRIRDYAAMIAEAAEDAVENISLRADAVVRAKELRHLAEAGYANIEKLQADYRTHQLDARLELERMVEKIEAMYYRFGLLESQEAAISNTVRSSKGEVLDLFNRYGADADGQFAMILDGLNRASAYRIDLEAGSAVVAEVWV
ncbi:MAG: response regulator [Rhodocyclaceae bacterium]